MNQMRVCELNMQVNTSIIKVDKFFSIESLKPIRLNIRSVMRKCALVAGT